MANRRVLYRALREERRRNGHTRSHPEHGSKALQGPWYCARKCVGESVVAGIKLVDSLQLTVDSKPQGRVRRLTDARPFCL